MRDGKRMLIAFYTTNDALYREISRLYGPDDCASLVRFTNPTDLIRSLQRNCAAVILFDVGRDASLALEIFAWRSCHFRYDVPLILISRTWPCATVIDALDGDADDIVVGPYAEEVWVRARRMIARIGGSSLPNRLSVGEYTIDRTASTVFFDGRNVSLTARELTLAWLFFSNVGTLLTREQIAMCVWGTDACLAKRSLEQHIYKLRIKLALDERRMVFLRTVYAVGYILVSDTKAACEVSQREAALPSQAS